MTNETEGQGPEVRNLETESIDAARRQLREANRPSGAARRALSEVGLRVGADSRAAGTVTAALETFGVSAADSARTLREFAEAWARASGETGGQWPNEIDRRLTLVRAADLLSGAGDRRNRKARRAAQFGPN